MGINSCRKGESRQKINYRRSEESRRKMVDKIMDTLQRHMPTTGPDGTNELRKIAVRFEDKIFKVTGNQQEYLRKISFKMRALESRANERFGNRIPGSSFGNNQRPLNLGFIQRQGAWQDGRPQD